jgi:hypothetical protein
MEREEVESSNLKSIGYREDSALLEVEFHSGAVYQYFQVPEAVYLDLMAAESLGSYFSKNIKGKYSYEKIE